MPTVTKPKPRLVSKHLSPPDVVPINVRHLKAHYVGKHSFTLLQWLPGAMLTVLALTAIWGGVLIFQKANYAAVGEMACRQGALPEPQILCAADDLDCLTNPTVVEVSRIKETIRERNIRMAKACISVL